MKLTWIILLGVLCFTHCCIGVYETEYVHENTHPKEHFHDDFEIDDTVWERELPPYFDDN